MPTEMQGYLEKGRFFTNTRYFALRNNALSYSDKPDTPVKLVLDLSHAQIRFDDKNSAIILSGDKVHPSRTKTEYYLCAKPKTLYFQWKVALRTVRDNNFFQTSREGIQAHGGVSSGSGSSGNAALVLPNGAAINSSGSLLRFPDHSEFNSLLVDGYRSCLRGAVELCLMESSEFAISPTSTAGGDTASNGASRSTSTASNTTGVLKPPQLDPFAVAAVDSHSNNGGSSSSNHAAAAGGGGGTLASPKYEIRMVSNLGNVFSTARYVPSEAALRELWGAHAVVTDATTAGGKAAGGKINQAQHECIFSQMMAEMQSTVPTIVEDIVCVVLRSNGVADATRHAKVITLNSRESIATLAYQYSHQGSKVAEGARSFWRVLDPEDSGWCAWQDFVSVYQTFPLVPQRDLVDITADEIAAQISRLVHAPTRSPALPICGLENLGNTCYFNSVLQALMHLPKLRQFLLLQKFDAATPNAAAAANSANSSKNRSLCHEFHSLLVAAGSTSARAISPFKIRAVFNKKTNNFFAGTAQHDAHEVLNAFLDIVHEELNDGRPHKWEQLPDVATKERGAFALSQIWWDSHLRQNQSIIQQLFHGQCACTTRCLNCGHTTMSFDPFSNLILPIPSLDAQALSPLLSPAAAAAAVDPFASVFSNARPSRAGVAVATTEQSHNPLANATSNFHAHHQNVSSPSSAVAPRGPTAAATTTLDDCMSAYCATETLTDFICEKCKAKGPSSKGAMRQTRLARPPFYLVVYLKRFSHDVLGRLVQKDKTPVAYPPRWNITQYVDEAMHSHVLVKNHLERCESVDFVAQMCGGSTGPRGSAPSTRTTSPNNNNSNNFGASSRMQTHQRSSSWDVSVAAGATNFQQQNLHTSGSAASTSQRQRTSDGFYSGTSQRRPTFSACSSASSSSSTDWNPENSGVGRSRPTAAAAAAVAANVSDIGEYELVATVDHIGRINYGHYMTNVRNFDTSSSSSGGSTEAATQDGDFGWYKCNDSRVTGLSEDWHASDDARASAYVLIYRLKPPQLDVSCN